MGAPVVHFEVIGRDAASLRAYYGELFGWKYELTPKVAPSVSADGEYGFTAGNTTGDGVGIPGGVGGGAEHAPLAVFYVFVPDVAVALEQAERLGGRRVMGPERNPTTGLVVGHFRDPEGNLLGVAGAR